MWLVAHFTAAERRLYRWTGRRLLPEGSFAPDEVGLQAWAACVMRHRGANLALVLDLPGEAYREERIPRLRGADRAALINRRLSQHFPDSRFAAAWFLPFRDSRPGRERLLLAAPGAASPIEPWLDALHAAGVALAGVHTSASLVPTLLARCAMRKRDGIAVVTMADGLRACCIEGGRARLARFLPANSGGESLADRIHGEAIKLLAHWPPTDSSEAPSRLPVLVIVAGARIETIRGAFAADARFEVEFLPIESALRQVRVLQDRPGDAADSVLLALAADRPPREQFARSIDRRGYLQNRQRRFLVAAGVATCMVCCVGSGAQWLQARGLQQQAAQAREQTRVAASRLAETAGVREVAGGDIDRVKRIVREAQRLAATAVAPEPAFAHLSRALARSPGIDLESMIWSVDPPATPGQPGDRVAQQTLEIAARVNRGTGDLRSLADEIAGFANRLRANGEWRIVRARLPFDLSSQGTFRDGIDGKIGGSDFSIVIARRPTG